MDFKYPITIYSKEVNPGKFIYKGVFGKCETGISSIPGYMQVAFKSNITVPNESRIFILDSWLKFYLDKDNNQRQCIFINDFIYENEIKKALETENAELKIKQIKKMLSFKLEQISRLNKGKYDISSAYKTGLVEGSKKLCEEVLAILKWK